MLTGPDVVCGASYAAVRQIHQHREDWVNEVDYRVRSFMTSGYLCEVSVD
jgi:hypothetical protein